MNEDRLLEETHMADGALDLLRAPDNSLRIEPQAGSWTWHTLHMHSVLQRLERRLTAAGFSVERVTREVDKRLIGLDVREVVSGMPGTVSGGTVKQAKRRARKDATPAPEAATPAPGANPAPEEGEPAPVAKRPRKRRATPADEVTAVGG
jgi:hypothetical protein